jgi:glycosyltransferase involved in cell wall biosynthesis
VTRPTIALCVPAYNAARYLPRLLKSAQAQNPPFDEVIVCDDASSDGTAAVAAEYGACVITNSVNQGCSQSKNNALACATSDYVHFHDADDELLPNFTGLARAWMDRDNCPDVVLFNFEYRDEATLELIGTSSFSSAELCRDPVRYAILHQINPFCGLYRRSKLDELGGYDIDKAILYNEDVAFHCKLAIAGLTFDAEPTVAIVNYRIAGSMSQANQLKCLRAHVAVMERVGRAVGAKYGAAIASRLWAAAAGLAVHGCWKDVDHALEEAGRLHGGVPSGQTGKFARLCQAIGAKRAFRVREGAIRLLRPALRR